MRKRQPVEKCAKPLNKHFTNVEYQRPNDYLKKSLDLLSIKEVKIKNTHTKMAET